MDTRLAEEVTTLELKQQLAIVKKYEL